MSNSQMASASSMAASTSGARAPSTTEWLELRLMHELSQNSCKMRTLVFPLFSLPKQKKSTVPLREKIVKQKQVWRKESLEKRPRSGGPVVSYRHLYCTCPVTTHSMITSVYCRILGGEALR